MAFSKNAAKRIASATRQVEKYLVPGAKQGRVLTKYGDDVWQWGKLLAFDSDTGLWTWKRQVISDTGAFEDPGEDALEGAAEINGLPAHVGSYARFYYVGGSDTIWVFAATDHVLHGAAVGNWKSNGPLGSNDAYSVMVNLLYPEGEEGDEVEAWILPSGYTSTAFRYGNPNVVADQIVLVQYYPAGLPVFSEKKYALVSECMDDKIGTVKFVARNDWTSTPQGWGIMDGTENSAENGGSGLSLLGTFPYATATAGDTGGNETHTHTVPLPDDHEQTGTGAYLKSGDETAVTLVHKHSGSTDPVISSEESSLPPYMTLLPIERLDNSQDFLDS